MRALTVLQPWAWAIVSAGKDIENRDWRTHYRGPIAIHSGARMHGYRDMPRGVADPDDDDLVLGAIVGVAEILDLVETSRSKWFGGKYGWKLAGQRALKRPIPCKGALQLWTVPRRSRGQFADSLGVSPAVDVELARSQATDRSAKPRRLANPRRRFIQPAELQHWLTR